MSLTVYVQPHLPCINNEMGLASGRTNATVSPKGEGYARFVRWRSPGGVAFDAIVTSPLPRCVRTVELCFGDLDVPVIEDDRVSAIDYGNFHSKTMSEIRGVQMEYVRRPFPAGESYEHMASRYAALLRDLEGRFRGGQVLLIGHNGTAGMLLHVTQGLPLEEAVHLGIYRASGARTREEFYGAYLGPYVYRSERP